MTLILRTLKRDITSELSLEEKSIIDSTSELYHEMLVYVTEVCCELKSVNGNLIHQTVYRYLMDTHENAFSELVNSARKSACASVKSFNSNVPRYNEQIKKKNQRLIEKGRIDECKPHLRKWLDYKCTSEHCGYGLTIHSLSVTNDISFSTIDGRITIEKKIPLWFTSRYPNIKVYSGRVSCHRVNKTSTERKYILYITFRVLQDVPELEETPERVIGVDRGIYHPIATSNGILYSSKKDYSVSRRYKHNISKLKQKTTSSARKRLRSMSGKEKRFHNDVANCISKILVNIPNVTTLVFEDLKGISEDYTKDNPKNGRKYNSWMKSWNFDDILKKTEYKGEAKGVKVETVSPKNTSKRCSNCGEIEKIKGKNRNANWYRCDKCGMKKHADINAGENIREKYLAKKYPEAVETYNEEIPFEYLGILSRFTQVVVNQPRAVTSESVNSDAKQSIQDCTSEPCFGLEEIVTREIASVKTD